MPIGGVVGCEKVIVPAFVGVDIGCGMYAVKTSLKDIDTDSLKTIMGEIRDSVPVGFNWHGKGQDDEIFDRDWSKYPIANEQYQKARRQLGTLGGGNHFIEIQKGDDDHIWFMIHSGSRNVGYTVANHYIKESKKLADRWFSQCSVGFIPQGDPLFDTYVNEMKLCLDFALANREVMASRIKDAFISVIECEFLESINIHHNYATLENHYDKNVWLHRKGATSAKNGEIGLIPGSQGTCSYVVKGKGCLESFMSCSHGAGRMMSRNEARKTLKVEDEQAKMSGILHSIRSEKDLDEAPSAYKDIDVVMSEQTDLVDVVVKLIPLGIIKG
jgi:tRNA-splicing ligase RtcB